MNALIRKLSLATLILLGITTSLCSAQSFDDTVSITNGPTTITYPGPVRKLQWDVKWTTTHTGYTYNTWIIGTNAAGTQNRPFPPGGAAAPSPGGSDTWTYNIGLNAGYYKVKVEMYDAAGNLAAATTSDVISVPLIP